MFHKGEEVVCVDDDLHHEIQQTAHGGLDGLKKGEIYHIRWCGIEPEFGTDLAVRLEEIFREGLDGANCPYEPVYFAWRFNRMVKKSKETDITLFKNLTKPKKKVMEDV